MRYPLQYARGTLYQLYITAACRLYKAQILGENPNVSATIDLGGGGGGAAIEYMRSFKPHIACPVVFFKPHSIFVGANMVLYLPATLVVI